MNLGSEILTAANMKSLSSRMRKRLTWSICKNNSKEVSAAIFRNKMLVERKRAASDIRKGTGKSQVHIQLSKISSWKFTIGITQVLCRRQILKCSLWGALQEV
jgi:hypothetical protein